MRLDYIVQVIGHLHALVATFHAWVSRRPPAPLDTSTAGKDYTGLLEASKTHFYGPRSGLIGVLAYI